MGDSAPHEKDDPSAGPDGGAEELRQNSSH